MGRSFRLRERLWPVCQLYVQFKQYREFNPSRVLRLFDCGIHKCEKPCHPPSTNPPICPRSPSLVSHCPCGKKQLVELEGGTRTKCTDPILTCGSLCMKELNGCDHVCSVPCALVSIHFRFTQTHISLFRSYRTLPSLRHSRCYPLPLRIDNPFRTLLPNHFFLSTAGDPLRQTMHSLTRMRSTSMQSAVLPSRLFVGRCERQGEETCTCAFAIRRELRICPG